MITDPRQTAIEQENKLLRQRNAELQQKLDCECARGFKAGHEAILRKNPSGCCCKFDEDDNLVEMCAAHKVLFLGEKLKTVKEIVIKYLEDHGYDGLYHDFNECSCRIHDLFEGTDQQDLCSTCHPGYEIKLDPTENAGLDWDIVSEKEWNEHREKAKR